jgi:hypothetical protein
LHRHEPNGAPVFLDSVLDEACELAVGVGDPEAPAEMFGPVNTATGVASIGFPPPRSVPWQSRVAHAATAWARCSPRAMTAGSRDAAIAGSGTSYTRSTLASYAET